MTKQRLVIALLFGIIALWRGPDWIAVKGMEPLAGNERLFSALFCFISLMSVWGYSVFRSGTRQAAVLLVHWLVLSLLAIPVGKAVQTVFWHALLVNAGGLVLTILLYETYFFIRKLEEK